MPFPLWFFALDTGMEVIKTAISLAIGYFAFKSFKIMNERTLLYLHFSFVLLGSGLLIHTITMAYTLVSVLVSPPLVRLDVLLLRLGLLVFFFTEVAAYGLLAFVYASQTKSVAVEAAIVPPILTMLRYESSFEVLVIFILVYITYQTAVNYSTRRLTNSLLVVSSFTLLTVSHILFLFSSILVLLYPIADIVQLVGFVALLTMLLRVVRKK